MHTQLKFDLRKDFSREGFHTVKAHPSSYARDLLVRKSSITFTFKF